MTPEGSRARRERAETPTAAPSPRGRRHAGDGARAAEPLAAITDQVVHAQAPMCVVRGADLECEVVNRAFLEIVDTAELAGKSMVDAVPDLAAQGYAATVREVMQHGLAAVQDEVRLGGADPDGGRREPSYWRFVHTPIRADDGAVTRVITVGTDITGDVLARRRTSSRMQHISTRLLEARDVAALLDEILEAAIDVTSADKGNVQLLQRGVLKIATQRGFDRDFVEFFDTVHAGEAVCGTAMQTRARVIVEDVATSPIFAGSPARDVVLGAGVRAVQSTPLVSRSGALLGMFSTHYRSARRPSDDALRVLDVLARQAADLIERAQAEQALRESESRFREVADRAPVVVWLLDEAGRCTFLSAAWQALTGQAPESGLGYGWLDAVHPDDRAHAREGFTAVRRHTDTFELEFRVRRDDGTDRSALAVVTPRAGTSGAPDGYVASVIDITERSHSEAARARLAAIVDSADDAIVSKSLDGVILSWNRGAERIFGWTAAEAVGRHITLIIPAERHSEEDEILGRIRRGLSVEHLETVRVAKDGRRLNIALTVSPVRDRRGRIIAASKIARDVTERRRLEEDRTHLAAIIDSADDAIVSKSLEGVIRSWNRGAERIFGWTAEEAVGRHITLIIPPERWPEEDEILARIRRGESLDHFETVRLARDGRRLNISLTVSPVTDREGRIIGASKIARDVTERRRLEDERDRLLIEAQASNRAKDQLLAMVSHELRTPLNSILGYARLLETGSLDEEGQLHAIGVITRSAVTQAQLVDDLLDLSRLTTGRMQVTFAPCDLAAIVESALEIVQPTADAKAVVLTTDLAPGVRIRGAADRLRQVVWNLLSNAIKFTPRGGHVAVTVTSTDTHAQVIVIDDGVGIGPEALPHVFELFRQEDSSSTRTQGGLGLGLALVKSLVELHGGHVTAESEGKGRGARFTVGLPLAPGGAEGRP